ncbi:hypothetical protein BZA05DRAFT_407284 [Tricharina praecox]|uniref:uncharacterized protein n=1 Tax=Tricharina praecox TaxID=43433 RepID=UPI0022204C0D|nr:uncharacterized protein BZA05DRAFT_407284 [Tricharina praecox]KAI5845905.1 hypothetical protein BZA05DRAFT_407284 [Tricharina praecox]
MNYTFLPVTPHPVPASPASSATHPSSGPVIILTVQSATKKTLNLRANPRVSLLVHDWVSHRASFSDTPSEDKPQQSSLATLLTNLNSACLSSISATLFGYAHLIDSGSDEEAYYKKVHTDNCVGAGESMCYLEGEDARIVVVTISWARVANHKGVVKDWVAPGEEQAWAEFDSGAGQVQQQVNGS